MRELAPGSPRVKAKIAGVLYFANLVTGIAAMMLIGHRLQAQGDAINLVAAVLYTLVTLLLCDLFWPVNRSLSMVAAVFSLLGCWFPAVAPHLPLAVHINNFVFFGLYCVLIGYLILRSTFMPPAIGGLMIFAGLCWLTTWRPALASALSPGIMIGGLIGEGSLIVWLLVRGVDEERWRQQAARL